MIGLYIFERTFYILNVIYIFDVYNNIMMMITSSTALIITKNRLSQGTFFKIVRQGKNPQRKILRYRDEEIEKIENVIYI